MTLERIKGQLYVECDGSRCHNFIDGSTDFDEVREELRTRGWKSHNSGGEWFHYCPDCQTDSLDTLTKGL